MKARQVRAYPEYGAVLIAARPRARSVFAGDSTVTNGVCIEGRVMKHVRGAQGE